MVRANSSTAVGAESDPAVCCRLLGSDGETLLSLYAASGCLHICISGPSGKIALLQNCKLPLLLPVSEQTTSSHYIVTGEVKLMQATAAFAVVHSSRGVRCGLPASVSVFECTIFKSWALFPRQLRACACGDTTTIQGHLPQLTPTPGFEMPCCPVAYPACGDLASDTPKPLLRLLSNLGVFLRASRFSVSMAKKRRSFGSVTKILPFKPRNETTPFAYREVHSPMIHPVRPKGSPAREDFRAGSKMS